MNACGFGRRSNDARAEAYVVIGTTGAKRASSAHLIRAPINGECSS